MCLLQGRNSSSVAKIRSNLSKASMTMTPVDEASTTIVVITSAYSASPKGPKTRPSRETLWSRSYFQMEK